MSPPLQKFALVSPDDHDDGEDREDSDDHDDHGESEDHGSNMTKMMMICPTEVLWGAATLCL